MPGAKFRRMSREASTQPLTSAPPHPKTRAMQSFDSDGVQIAYIDVPAKEGENPSFRYLVQPLRVS